MDQPSLLAASSAGLQITCLCLILSWLSCEHWSWFYMGAPLLLDYHCHKFSILPWNWERSHGDQYRYIALWRLYARALQRRCSSPSSVCLFLLFGLGCSQRCGRSRTGGTFGGSRCFFVDSLSAQSLVVDTVSCWRSSALLPPAWTSGQYWSPDSFDVYDLASLPSFARFRFNYSLNSVLLVFNLIKVK